MLSVNQEIWKITLEITAVCKFEMLENAHFRPLRIHQIVIGGRAPPGHAGQLTALPTPLAVWKGLGRGRTWKWKTETKGKEPEEAENKTRIKGKKGIKNGVGLYVGYRHVCSVLWKFIIGSHIDSPPPPPNVLTLLWPPHSLNWRSHCYIDCFKLLSFCS